ncbi:MULTISPECIES: efflux RND transporter periplasmic adaptor subunit [Rhodomicrobium]|uniref:efflux RND transporter periplasmic adaptor subunit n=1 Tax=Rhodomicrobium TaxID=1068 RepID=UPI000B4BCC49|nr:MULTISPECIES: efflux RND transporter periplasmic adaptor subunit [Rhodomicrobium]
MKRILPALILILVTAAAVAFIYKDKIFPKPPGESAENGRGGGGGGGRRGRRSSDPNRAVSILAEAAKTENVPIYLHGVGTVQAFNTATVRAEVSGRLIEVGFTEGQNVKQGDVLARIDPATYQAAYDQAVAKKAQDQASLANQRADLVRYESLAKANYSSQQQADTQKALVAQTEALIRQDQGVIDNAKTDLDRTTIVAPMAGRTGLREVDVGNLVSAGDTGGIVVITQIQPISVVFTLPETYVGELIQSKAAGPVALEASVGGKIVGTGALDVIDNRIDQNTGTVRMKGTFPNEALGLWPGQFVNIRLHLKTLTNATVVPSAAVQQGAAGRFVYRIEPEDRVKLVPVEVAQEGEDLTVIGKGIQPGEKVATSGFSNLQDGSKVSIADPNAPAENAAPNGERRRRRNQDGQGDGAKPAAPGPTSSEQPQGGDATGANPEAKAAQREGGPAQ